MGLVGTLGKLALGYAVSKGVGKMMGRGGAGGGLGGLLGGLKGGGAGGGLGDLGALLGGSQQQQPQGNGGVGGPAEAGGLGGLLESIGGGNSAGGGLGDLFNTGLQGNPTPPATNDQEAMAKIMIQAMINSAKADGTIDQAEQQKIVSQLGDDLTEDERQFIVSQMQSPLDLDGFTRSIPNGSEQQVYLMSLLGIDLDSQEEARYLDKLRTSMGMSEQQCNAIHQKLGVPTIYS
jgi:uncharacterized membrane protein YebE (DUF533 family)